MAVLTAIVLNGCVSQEERSAAQAVIKEQKNACERSGGTVYEHEYGRGRFECISNKDQKRFEQLELACVSAGGTVLYKKRYGYYKNCYKASASSDDGYRNPFFCASKGGGNTFC